MIFKERIILTITIAIIGILLISRYKPKTKNDEKFEWDRLWIFKTHSGQKYDYLVCGDSRVYRGISALAIKRNLASGNVFNYGYSSASFSGFMLNKMEDKLDKDSRHPTLILGITPYSLTTRASEDAHIKEELARKKEEIIELLYMAPLKRIVDPISIEFLFNSDQDEPDGGPVYHQEISYKEGWVASSKNPADPNAALASYAKNFEGNTVLPTMIDSLLLKVKSWREEGISIYGFRPPTTTAMVNLEDSLSGFNETDFKTRFQNAGGTWLSFSPSDFESYDGSHLTKSSAVNLSEQLAKMIRAKESENETRGVP